LDIETQNTFEEVGSADPAMLDISVVGVYDSKDDSYYAYEEHEFPKLWPVLESADILIGYNSDHFDIPCLNRYYPGDLIKIKSVDLLKEIRNSLGRRLRLDSVAEATLGMNKSGHGLQAITWWRAGEKEKVKSYCLDDVRITKELYDYARKHKKLMFKDGLQLRDIRLDPSGWEKVPEGSAMTHTLPF
jgi:DEAD/DEAH box helicase domain-containing protein